jgi:hypothetical protein
MCDYSHVDCGSSSRQQFGSSKRLDPAVFENADVINTFAFFQAKNTRQKELNLAANTLDGIASTALPSANEVAKRHLRELAQSYRTKAQSYESEPDTGEGKKELLKKARQAEEQRNLSIRLGLSRCSRWRTIV